jgi:hypothetical protein
MILTALSLAALVATAPAVVPDPPGPYAWVCSYLDAAPTLFGVMGLPGEAADRGLVLDPDAVTATVAADCPEHAELLDSSLGLVVGG